MHDIHRYRNHYAFSDYVELKLESYAEDINYTAVFVWLGTNCRYP